MTGVTAVPSVIPGAVSLPVSGAGVTLPSASAIPTILPPGTGPGSITAAAVGRPVVPAVDLKGLTSGRTPLVIAWFLVLGVVAGIRPQWAIGLTILSILGVLTYMHGNHTGIFWGSR